MSVVTYCDRCGNRMDPPKLGYNLYIFLSNGKKDTEHSRELCKLCLRAIWLVVESYPTSEERVVDIDRKGKKWYLPW